MERVVRITVLFAVIGAIAFTLFGGVARGAGPVIFVPFAVVLGGIAFLRRSGASVELGWAGRTAKVTSAAVRSGLSPVAIGAYEPVGAARPAAPPRRVVAALARVEARELRRSPWFEAGIGFCVLLAVLFGWLWTDNSDIAGLPWMRWFVLLPIMAFPMTGMVVIASHRAVTRGQRDGCDEMFRACPVGEATRTTAHVRAGWVPSAALAVFVIGITSLLLLRKDANYGPVGGRGLAYALSAVALGACGASLGVALARWAPWQLVPMVFVAALAPIIGGVGGLGAPHWSNLRQLSPWPRYPDHDLLFTAPPAWWHLVWLVALGALMGVIAFLHARRDRRALTVAAVVVIVALIAGVAETRPISRHSAQRLASLIAEPERHQTCRSVPHVELCAYRPYSEYLKVALANAAPVAAALPDVVPTTAFRQHFIGPLNALGSEVNAQLRERVRPPVSYAPLGFQTRAPSMAALRMRIAFAAVGLPVDTGPDRRPTVAAGQARGVVALWLAARGAKPAAALAMVTNGYKPADHPAAAPPSALALGSAWPDPCEAGPAPVAWSAQDLEAARRLLARPAREVLAVVRSSWTRFIDPATPTDDLLAALGVQPVGRADAVTAEPIVCPY